MIRCLIFTNKHHLKSKPGALKCHLLCCSQLFPTNTSHFQVAYLKRHTKIKEHNHLPLNEHKRYSVLFLESIKYVLKSPLKALLYIATSIPLWVKHIQKK